VFFALLGSLSKSLNVHSEYIYALENWLGGDKYLHFIVSFSIGFTVTWTTPRKIRPYFLSAVGYPTVFFFLAITSDELLQVFFPTREFSVYDLSTNIVGMLSGIVIYRIIEKASKIICKEESHNK
jgi:VanZ family protein